jgi:hypothetical protein
LRSDDAAERVTAWQDDAATIDFGLGAGRGIESRDGFPLDQGASAGGTPVGDGLRGKYGVAMAA